MGILNEVSKFFLVGVILSWVATVFDLIAMPSMYWCYYSGNNLKVYWGLWRRCTEVLSITSCSSLVSSSNEDWVKATQALSLIGFFILIATVITGIIKLTCKRDSKILTIVLTACVFCGVLFVFLGAVIFAAKTTRELAANATANFHVSFAFAILTCIVGTTGGVLLVIDLLKGGNTVQQKA